MRRAAFWLLAPFILGVYPTVHLYSINAGHVASSALLEPLLDSLGISAGLVVLSILLTRRFKRGILTACTFIFLSFFLTGVLDALFPRIMDSAANQFINAVLVGVVFLGSWLVNRELQKISDLSQVMRVVTTCAFILIGMPLVGIARYHAHQSIYPEDAVKSQPLTTTSRALFPDVYYIILDGYARADVLRRELGYDNSRFISYLTRHGFYVADKSRSNYAYTYLSLASSLNMEYLDGMDRTPNQQVDCLRRIQDNTVIKLFKGKGYRIRHFSSGWSVTDYNPHADVTYRSHHIGEFHNLLIRNSVLRFLLQREWVSANKARILYTIEELKDIQRDSIPTFTFVHLLCPHPPYVFDRSGHTPPPETYSSRPSGSHDWYPKSRYTDQVDYLNHLIEEVVGRLLTDNRHPPIIILQGDHGAACDGTSAHPTRQMVRERMNILNAYYVPDDLRTRLYPTITPVNSFRLIGNYLFGARFGTLADRSYYSGPMDATPYHFVDIKTLLPKDD